MSLSACAPSPFELFLSPNPNFDQQKGKSKSYSQQQEPEYQPGILDSAAVVQASPSGSSATTILSQLNEALIEAEAHVRAGEARMQEQRPFDAFREFERARLLIEQDVDPTLHYIESQASVQGGMSIMSTSSIQRVQTQREDLLARTNRVYDFYAMYAEREAREKVNVLRKANKPNLQPISLAEEPRILRESRLLISPKPQPVTISSVINLAWVSDEETNRYISRFLRRDADFHSCLVRANQYFPQVASILTGERVPEDLAYIALIESGFQPSAKSSSGEAGLWQLSRSTARTYGLTVTSQVDDRVNIHESTRAFARYMDNLYRRFGSWELAIMAYAVGKQGLQNTINRIGSYDIQVLNRSM